MLEKALKESHSQERLVHEQKIAGLRTVIDRAQQRIEVMYEDRLDKRISPEEFDARFKVYSLEKEDALKELKKLDEDNTRYYEAGFAVHELATCAKEIYLSPTAHTEDPRLLLSYAFSGLILSHGKLDVVYTPAFEFLAKWAPQLNKDFEPKKTVANKRQKAASATSCPTLLRDQDSNLEPTP